MKFWPILKGGPKEGRYLRYAIVLFGGYGAVLALAAALFLFTPRVYESGYTVILPGAGPSSSVNLDSFGQASSNSASPFSDHTLSPTENYKRLLQSYRLRGIVAENTGRTVADTPPPRIRLANQTKLIYVTIQAADPDEAKLLADAWLQAFQRQLDALRREEQTIREDAYRATISGFEEAVSQAQSNIVRFQAETGLMSLAQFQQVVSRSDALKADLVKAEADAAVLKGQLDETAALLAISPDAAAGIMALQSDAAFQALARGWSVAEADRAELTKMFGKNHPELSAATEESAGLREALTDRGRILLGFRGFSSVDEAYYASTSELSGLVAELVRQSAAYEGAYSRLETVRIQFADTTAQIQAMAEPAARLEALLREHKVAETVLASAIARVDANRTDIFASYPLTQIIESPALPEAPVSPSKKMVALGVIATLFLYTIGLVLLWIRLPLIRALLKTV